MSKYLLFLLVLIPLLSFSHEGHKGSSYPFIKNEGQWHEEVYFKTELEEASIFFTSYGIRYQFVENPAHHGENLKTNESLKAHFFNSVFLNSNKNPEVEEFLASESYNNYYLGNNPEKWKAGIKSYNEILLKEIYPGINVRYYFKEGYLKYDFELKPKANYKDIKIKYEGVEMPKLNKEDLYIEHAFGTLIEKKPIAFQSINGSKNEIPCLFNLDEEGILTFKLPNDYDSTKSLIIDPQVVFSTYSGSNTTNFGMTATYDNSGNGYMGGTIFANNYNNTINGFQKNYGGGTADIAISKFNESGSRLLFNTFLGGVESEAVASMVVNSRDELIVLAISSSADYPVTAAAYKMQKTNSIRIDLDVNIYSQDYVTGNDIAISKFSRNGQNLLASTFFGGNSSDGLNFDASSFNTISSFNSKLVYNYGDHFRGEIATDPNDTIYIGTSTHSSDLDTSLGQFAGLQEGLIIKFGPNLDTLIWSRYLGGSADDAIYSLKITDRNEILVGGGTRSFTSFPTTPNSYAPSSFGGRSDGFMTLLNRNGNIIYSTFLGTTTYDQAYFVESDRFNNLYAFGQTNNPSFPNINTSISNPGAGQFIMKLDSTLSNLQFSHTFGNSTVSGRININPTAFLVDRCLNIYTSGWGGSIRGGAEGSKILQNMPLTLNTAEQTTTDGNDFYFYVTNRDLDSLVYASYLGGNQSDDHVDGGTSRFSKNGIIYQSICASCRAASDFPTTPGSAFPVKVPSLICNNALYKYDFEIIPVASFFADTLSFCLAVGDTVAVTIEDRSKRANDIIWDFYGTPVQGRFQNGDTTIFITSPGNYIIGQTVLDTVCATDAFTSQTIFAFPDDISFDKLEDTIVCYSDTFDLKVNTSNSNLTIVSRSPLFDTILGNPADSIVQFPLRQGLDTFYIRLENSITEACPKFDTMTIFYEPVLYRAFISEDTICENTAVNLTSFQFNVDTFLWDFGNGNFDGINENISVFYNTPGDYQISLTVFNQVCDTTDAIPFDLNVQANSLQLDSILDTLYCGMNDLELNINSNGTANSFLWSSRTNFLDTLNNYPLDSNLVISNEGERDYFIKVSDRYCERSSSTTAKVIRLDLGLGDILDSVCTPYSTEIQTTIIGTDSFRINYGEGQTTNSDTFPIANYNTPGIFTVSLIGYNDECAFQDTIEQIIEVFQGIELAFLNDTLICRGESVNLNINSNGTATSFIWSEDISFQNPLNPPTDSTYSTTPQDDITYFYKGIDGICESDSSLTIFLDSVLIEADDFNAICLEDSIFVEARELFSRTPLNYNWEPKSNIISGDQTNIIQVSPNVNQIYSVTATNQIGCEDFATAEVEVNVPVFTDADINSSKDSSFKGEPIQLSTNRNGSNLTYQWSPPEFLDNPLSANPKARPLNNTIFSVTITDQNTGCEVVAFKRYSVFEINCAEPDIFIPTAFTPNGDGNNDIFYLRGDNVESIEMIIYNRWGEEVFMIEDKNTGWDGIYKGRAADPAVFVYDLKAICFDGQEFIKKGNFTLIR